MHRPLSFAALALIACQAEVKEGPPPTTATNTPPPATATATATTPATAATPAPTPTTAPTTAPTTTATTATTDPPEPTEPAMQMKLSVADGRPKGLKEGAPEAFWIWHEDKGKSWHVRTTTKKALHRFTGLVAGEGQPITELHLVKTEHNDKIRGTSKGIGFDFETQGNEDGFDFKTAGNSCVRFAVKVDGKASPAIINVGATDAHPPHWHFKLCP
jgi:hypothetical protein